MFRIFIWEGAFDSESWLIDLEGVNGAPQAPGAITWRRYWIEGSRSRTSPPTRLELSDFIMRRYISPQD